MDGGGLFTSVLDVVQLLQLHFDHSHRCQIQMCLPKKVYFGLDGYLKSK